MGWNFVTALRHDHELHIITEYKFKEDLERYFEKYPDESRFYHFYFIRKERRKMLRKIWPASYYWFYRAWQKKAYTLAQKLDDEEDFDLIHQLNMVGYREPGYLWKMKKPVVWGPIGGFNITPWRMLPALGLYGSLFYFSRNVINLCQMHFKMRVRQAMSNCVEIVSATQDTHDAVLALYGRKSRIIPEVGLVGSGTTTGLPERKKGERLRIAWSGEHSPGKALNILLKALHELSRRDEIEVHVMGKGKYTARWKDLADRLGVQNNVVWHGWMPREKAIEVMKSCHMMVITSLSDLTSTVLLEALSFGLPVIAMDHCGFANVITDKCGIKIPIGGYKEVVGNYTVAIEKMCSDEPLRRELSKGALERAKDFSWEGKLKEINETYREVMR